MKREATISLSAAVLSLVLLPNFAQANTSNNSSNSGNSNTAAERSEALRMVPARAVLNKTIDARKVQQGQQFQATLDDKVKLKDGQELPRGAILYGTVVVDQMHSNGNSKLTLRFTNARLKGGETIPIQATITGVFPAGSSNDAYDGFWTPNTLNIDQLGAVSGVDLHSRIDGKSSGTFIASKKDDVKLTEGSQLYLAIAAQQGANASNGGA